MGLCKALLATLFVVCGASLCRAAPLAAQGTSEQRRVALVIGNGAYDHITPLKNAVNDGQDMCAALKALGFDTQCHANLRTRAEFRAAVRQFAARLEPGVSALFYFAGHGVQVKGENFLLPTAIAPTSVLDVEDEGLGLGLLLRSIEDARSAPNVVILDTCRNDPFAGPQSLKVARGLARVEPPVGSVLVYATAPGREALDGRGRNGLFTKHLLRHIGEPALSLSQLFETVARQVEHEARADHGFEQVPYRSFSYAGAFCFAGCQDQQVQQQLDALQQQGVLARRRIQELLDENTRLASQSQAAGSQLRQQYEQREAEIRALKDEIRELSAQSLKLEAFAARIQALEQENQEKTRRLNEQGKAPDGSPQRTRVAPAF
jgi:uncharacterized caspase-like protein